MTDEQLDSFIGVWTSLKPDSMEQFLGELCYCDDTLLGLKESIIHGYTLELKKIKYTEYYTYVFNSPHSYTDFQYRYCVPKKALDSVEKDLKEAGEILCNGEPIGYYEDLDLIPTRKVDDPILDLIMYREEGMSDRRWNFSDLETRVTALYMNELTNGFDLDRLWLDECNYKSLEEAKEENMNAVTVNFMNGCTNRFEGKSYTYLIEGTYKEGDYLIFKNYNDNCVVVKVVAFTTDLDTLDKSINYKELTVLGTADMTPYLNEVKRQEKEKRKAQIMEELEANFEEANKMNLYRELAKQDQGMAELLKELDSLDK